jgi:hypothetical protein
MGGGRGGAVLLARTERNRETAGSSTGPDGISWYWLVTMAETAIRVAWDAARASASRRNACSWPRPGDFPRLSGSPRRGSRAIRDSCCASPRRSSPLLELLLINLQPREASVRSELENRGACPALPHKALSLSGAHEHTLGNIPVDQRIRASGIRVLGAGPVPAWTCDE